MNLRIILDGTKKSLCIHEFQAGFSVSLFPKNPMYKKKLACYAGYAQQASQSFLFTIEYRSCQKFSKQICLLNLAQGIGIIFIIQIVGAIWFFCCHGVASKLRMIYTLQTDYIIRWILHQSILIIDHRCSRPKSFWEESALWFHRPSDRSIAETPQ